MQHCTALRIPIQQCTLLYTPIQTVHHSGCYLGLSETLRWRLRDSSGTRSFQRGHRTKAKLEGKTVRDDSLFLEFLILAYERLQK